MGENQRLRIEANVERKILGFRLARSENEEETKVLIKSLKLRGILGSSLKFAITDDNPALKNALKLYYPSLLVQNCIVHKMRKVMHKTSHKNKAAVIADTKEIFNSESKE